MTIKEKLAYVKGLVEGLELDKSKPEVRVLSAIVELLDDVTLSVSDLEEGYDDLADQVDEIDEDLCALEEDFYDEECDCCDGEDDVFYEVTCPTCGETVCVSEEILLDGGIECPNCSENLEFDLNGLSLSGKCDCGDDCDCEPECNCESTCECEPTCNCEPECTC